MLEDGHMHLEYGDLSVDYVLQFVEQAKLMKLDRIQILDHTHRFKEFKCCYENLRVIEVQDKWLSNEKMKFKDTLDDYVLLINKIKSMNLDIEVLFGLEVCYVPEYEELIKSILKNYNFDFLVGAIHSIDGMLYDMPFSKEILWDKFNADYIYTRYYDLIYSLMKSNIFTQLAHPDTIKLFQIYPDFDLLPIYEKVSYLGNKYKIKIENNTGCHYRYNHPDVGLNPDFLKVLRMNDNEIITASDAHYPYHVGKYIEEANKL